MAAYEHDAVLGLAVSSFCGMRLVTGPCSPEVAFRLGASAFVLAVAAAVVVAARPFYVVVEDG